MRSSPHPFSAAAHTRHDARHAPMLDAESEHDLVQAFQGGSQEALRRLIASHMRLVVSIADRYARRGLAEEDLFGEGVLGLIEAAHRFDLDRGIRFGTYAAWWVRAYIRRYAMANRRIVAPPSTRAARRILSSLRRTERILSAHNGRRPDRDEVAAAIGVSTDELTMVEGLLGGRDLPIGPTEDGIGFEPVSDRATPEQEAADDEVQARNAGVIRAAMRRLSDRERTIVEHRILDDERTSLAELGVTLGLSRERVRQLEKRAQLKLRDALLDHVA